jgi:hypothetical protein
MPISQNFNIQWLNHNSQRHFPLAFDATTKSVNGEFTLPDDFLVSLYLSIPTSLNVSPASFTIRTIQAFSTGFSVIIGYFDGTTVLPVARGAVLRDTHTLYRTYPMRGLGSFYDVAGHMTIGRLENIDLQPPGEWQFDLTGGRLEVDSVRPQIRGVSSIQIKNGIDLSAPITGDVILSAGENIRLELSAGDTPEISISAIDGAGLNEECVCEGGNQPTQPIKTINGIGPDGAGNFTLLGTNCLTINPGDNGLQLDDKCAKPCCGCKELEVITDQLELLGKQAETDHTFMNDLRTAVNLMSQMILGAKLGDQGCSS